MRRVVARWWPPALMLVACGIEVAADVTWAAALYGALTVWTLPRPQPATRRWERHTESHLVSDLTVTCPHCHRAAAHQRRWTIADRDTLEAVGHMESLLCYSCGRCDTAIEATL